jgi:hypothetical protein
MRAPTSIRFGIEGDRGEEQKSGDRACEGHGHFFGFTASAVGDSAEALEAPFDRADEPRQAKRAFSTVGAT